LPAIDAPKEAAAGLEQATIHWVDREAYHGLRLSCEPAIATASSQGTASNTRDNGNKQSGEG